MSYLQNMKKNKCIKVKHSLFQDGTLCLICFTQINLYLRIDK